jgi:hypothetical protein
MEPGIDKDKLSPCGNVPSEWAKKAKKKRSGISSPNFFGTVPRDERALRRP